MKSEAQGWFRPAFAFVAAITGLRLLALAFNRTDLFVDESQYWLWSQNLDFGYYSKPPLIGWAIRLVTDLAGSDSPFWVRMPGAVLHGVTALVLGAVAARLADRSAAIWTAVLYVTLPFVVVGSLLISTDTIMAPFYALALLFWLRAAQESRAPDAALAGASAGAAFLAKYAAIYLVPGLVLAMLLAPQFRTGWRNALLAALAFGAVISPNVLWNLTHDLTTVEHTMDNVGWVRGGATLNFASMAEFLASQFAVFGPIAMAALIWGVVTARRNVRGALAVLSLPPLVAVTVQALLSQAYANWAVAAYFPGTVLVAMILPGLWRRVALALNLIVVVAFPLLTVLAPWPERDGEPLLRRYLGRAELSREILDLARAEGVPVLAANRDILADLLYTGRDSVIAIYAPRPEGRARHYYEQNYALPEGFTGRVLAIQAAAPDCGAGPLAPVAAFSLSGYWSSRAVAPYLVDAECLNAAD
ncbi:ArnT family glycosyltransferase [Sedimentimonas flavescens]|uniref:ArnT family glycosyltransferase n=1 Tax=Sedimentimonas flavescens TaxID=2851012 RepID=UPI001C4A3042|nr:glycosyltransferase family 39 protein [Sedimentimonas flavescens]MBW0158983.1 glycosyltransferase family 39 protein [Sedimentimonas flavescens]